MDDGTGSVCGVKLTEEWKLPVFAPVWSVAYC